MAKSLERIKAREMRREGGSIKDIGRVLHVSPSSVSSWCEDIILTPEQAAALESKKSVNGEKGRLAWARIRKERKANRILGLQEEGIRRMEDLSEEESLMLGLGLYFGEGRKGDDRFQFTNSNPALVKFMVSWLERSFNVQKIDMYCRVLINQLHAYRISKVEEAWSEILDIPLNQFRTTTLVKAVNKKVYENQETHFGTLALCTKRSTDFQRQLLGLLHGLVYNIKRDMPA